MTTDISRIRQSLKECEEVTRPYKFPYKCWIKYITIKGEDEAFYEGGQYVGMGDHKIFLINKGKRLCAPTCVRSDDGDILYKSRFFIDSKKTADCADDNKKNVSMEISSKKDIMNMLKQISKCCSQKDEYITIHTSITEGVIREILAAANKPIDSEKVSTSLRNRWALTPFPKSIDKNIIEKIAKSNKWIATSTNEV